MNSDSVRHPAFGPGIQPNRATCAGRPVAPEAAQIPHVPTDGYEAFDAARLTPDGRIRLIVSFDDADSARAGRETCGHTDGWRVGEDLPLVNGFTAEVEPKTLTGLLKTLPEGSRIALDRQLDYPDPRQLAPRKNKDGTVKQWVDVSSQVIGIQKVWDQGYTGKGQTIAVVDSGIYPHPDLKDKIIGWIDMTEGSPVPVDTFGHGTHVAGVAAGSGVSSKGVFKGIAPDANLVGVRITSVAEAIKGIQWVIENKEKYNIGVLNMSLGDFATRSYKDDPWAQAAQKALEAGIVVVVAAGNEGPGDGSVSTPGTNPAVITVGALNDKGTVDRSDDSVADFSSRGPTTIDGIAKPDLLAPGVGIYGPLAPGATLDVPELPHFGKDYFAISGTSMATPEVAGMAAIMLQANPKLSHEDVKQILVQSADRYLPDGVNAQGAGLLDAQEALQLALHWPEGRVATPPPPAPDAQPMKPPPAALEAPDRHQGFLFA